MTHSSIYRIVVGHDLAPTGDLALEQAVALARRVEPAEIHVIHSIAKPSRRGVDATSAQLDAAMTELRARASLMVPTASDGLTTHLHVRFGDVIETLQQVAVDYDATLLMVGTHGHQGLDRVRHRSVAERLVRTARLPVLVARAKDFGDVATTIRPDAARPGEVLHPEHGRAMSEVWIPTGRPSHISGLV